MKLPDSFFAIKKEYLNGEKIFPFHLYIYNPGSDSYSPFLLANSPFTKEKENFLDFITNKGGMLAVGENQKLTFLKSTNFEENQIESLKERELTAIEIEREKRLKALVEKREKSGKKDYNFKEGLKDCVKADNYLPMIESAREELMTFSVTNSHTVSLASYLAEKLLTKDNYTNRIVAVSYYLSKIMNIKDETSLSDITCASFFCHLGMTQIDFYLSHKPHLEYNDSERRKFRKHPGYSHHVVLKADLELSDRCKNLIFQHHERNDGSGFPSMKRGEYLDQLALILGAVTHVFEYSTGKVSGLKQPLSSVIRNLKNKTFTPGLEFEFGDKIFDNLVYLIDSDKEEQDSNYNENIAA